MRMEYRWRFSDNMSEDKGELTEEYLVVKLGMMKNGYGTDKSFIN